MATVALAAATAKGGILAGLSGVPLAATQLAAGIVDGLLVQQVFKQKPPEGQRLNDLQFTGTSEGSPANRLFGRTVRAAGTLVWMPRTREVKDSSKGGKGGSNAAFAPYRTFANASFELSRTFSRPVLEVKKLYLNGQLFYNVDADLDVTSTLIPAREEITTGLRAQASVLVLTSDTDAGGPDLSDFVAGRDCVVSGFTDGTHELATGKLVVNQTQSGSVTSSTYDQDEGEIDLRTTGGNSGWVRAGHSFTLATDSTLTEYIATEDTFFEKGEQKTIKIVPQLQDTVTNNDPCVISTNGASNNGTFRVISSGYDDRTDISFMRLSAANRGLTGFRTTTFLFGSKDAGDSVTLTQDLPSFSTAQANDVRFQLGEANQAADPIIVEFEEDRLGAGRVPGFVHRVTATFEDLELTDFGVLPQVEAEIQVSDDNTFATALSRYCEEDLGLGLTEFDVSAITATFEGAIMRGLQSAETHLAPMLIAGNILPVDRAGVLTFLDRTSLTEYVIPSGNLAARADGGSDESPFLHQRPSASRRIDKVLVNFLDPDQDFKQGQAPSRSVGVVRNPAEISLDLAMTRDQATQLADQTLDAAEVQQGRVRFTLPPTDMDKVQAGTVCDLGTNYGQADWKVLVDTVELGQNGLLVCSGERYDAEVFTQTKTGMTTGSS